MALSQKYYETVLEKAINSGNNFSKELLEYGKICKLEVALEIWLAVWVEVKTEVQGTEDHIQYLANDAVKTTRKQLKQIKDKYNL